MYYMYKDRHENDKCRLQEDEDLRKKKEQEEREVPGGCRFHPPPAAGW